MNEEGKRGCEDAGSVGGGGHVWGLALGGEPGGLLLRSPGLGRHSSAECGLLRLSLGCGSGEVLSHLLVPLQMPPVLYRVL